MKKALKIIIPVVLVLALLATACWFFFFYNPSLTGSLLLDMGDSMAGKGRYERAVTYYNWAWSLMPEDESCPQKLADTYEAAENYTKAEYTLVNAIAATPGSADLYVQLCQVYVKQDKFLDAVSMLDRISDSAVKAKLDALRPAAPVVTPESGYYQEHIEVNVSSDADRVYVTTSGEYPSNDSQLYSGPITLDTGETPLTALAVSADGLVSPAVTCGYTIGGVVEEVQLQDPVVDLAVRMLLSLDSDAAIFTDDLWEITALELPETVTDLSDLPLFTGLQSLKINNVSGLSFEVLRSLTELQSLDLTGCTISSDSMSAIGSLPSLQALVLDSCALTDISALAPLVHLETLSLSQNSISDIGVLSLMAELKAVNLSSNPLTSIAGLSACSMLESVDLTGCAITSIGSLSDKHQLAQLLLADNQIKDLSPLAGCRKMSVLNVSGNHVEDLSVISKMPKLTALEANNNLIKKIPVLNAKTSILVSFSADHNLIEDLSPLTGISTLNYVNLDYNQVKAISPLLKNPALIEVNLWDNPIEDLETAIPAFKENFVIVNYNPNFEIPEKDDDEKE